MTYADGRFLLVREELDDSGSGSRSRRTVLRELTVGKEPEIVRVVRVPEAANESGFIRSSLTPDGNRYVWVGPRLPPQSRRAEVREVSTGRLIRRVLMAEDQAASERYASLRGDGRVLWVNTREGARRFPLTDPESLPEEVAECPLASSQSDWSVFAERRPSNASDQILLRRSPERGAAVPIRE